MTDDRLSLENLTAALNVVRALQEMTDPKYVTDLRALGDVAVRIATEIATAYPGADC